MSDNFEIRLLLHRLWLHEIRLSREKAQAIADARAAAARRFPSDNLGLPFVVGEEGATLAGFEPGGAELLTRRRYARDPDRYSERWIEERFEAGRAAA